MNILITSALSAQSYQLKSKLTADNILLGDYGAIPEFMQRQGVMIQLPVPQSASYAHQMLTLCLDNAIDILYVLNKMEAEALFDARQLFTEYNIEIIEKVDEV